MNFNLKLQNYTTGLDKQIFMGERLRYSISDLITRTECAFPLAESEKNYLSEKLVLRYNCSLSQC